MPQETQIACTLNAADRTARIAAMRELGHALVGLEVSDRRALLRLSGGDERVDALVAAERACCAFLEFAMTRHGQDTELEIRTPEGGMPALRGLVAAIVAGWEGGLD